MCMVPTLLVWIIRPCMEEMSHLCVGAGMSVVIMEFLN